MEEILDTTLLILTVFGLNSTFFFFLIRIVGGGSHVSVLFFLIFIYSFIYLFIHLWLCWVFVSVRGLSLVVASGDHSSSRCAGLSL